jgi:hypothetical protein
VQWITDVAVPIALGLLAAFGATWFSNRKNTQRIEREANDRAADAIRAYIRTLHDTSGFLEARAIGNGGGWDPTNDVINHGGQAAVRDAYNAAAPYFHRLDVREADKNPLRNEFPDYGSHAMEGADNFHLRAKQVQTVFDRGLIGSTPARRRTRS